MKKFIVAIALMLSATTAFAGPKIGNWEVDFKQERITNEIVETQYTTSISLTKEGYFLVFVYDHNTADGGFNVNDIVTKKKMIMSVNGTNVKMDVDIASNGVMRLITTTDRGNTHIANEFWNKRQVNFLVNGNHFRASAMGVQKAYFMLKGGMAI